MTDSMCTCEPGYCAEGCCFICADPDAMPAECHATLEGVGS